jgi:hypothetical protein
MACLQPPGGGNRQANLSAKLLQPMKHFSSFYVFTSEENISCMWRRNVMMINVPKQPPLVEDLRNHSQEQIAELRQLLAVGAPSRPDPRRPGFYEVEGLSSTYYVFKYPTGTKVLLLGVWGRESDPAATMAAYSCPAA